MRFWVVKGRPAENEFGRMLRPRALGRWRTARLPKEWSPGDRLFFWAGTPVREVVGLGQLVRVLQRASASKDHLFDVRYASRRLESPVGIDWLRRDRIIGSASFLKAGPSGTVFPLSGEQGERLYALVCRRNASVRDVWPDLPASDEAAPADLELERLAAEGRRRLVRHFRRERKSWLVAEKKRDVRQSSGSLGCEVCEFDFAAVYGTRGDDYCEVHHRRPLAADNAPRSTSLKDLAVVCANCHRMLHRSPWLAVGELRRLLARRRARIEGQR